MRWVKDGREAGFKELTLNKYLEKLPEIIRQFL